MSTNYNLHPTLYNDLQLVTSRSTNWGATLVSHRGHNRNDEVIREAPT